MRIKKTTKEFISESNKIHNFKYEYNSEYLGNRIKIKIICPEHGEFEQRPVNHLSGQGCPKCGKKKPLSNVDFVEKSNLIHNNKYDYPDEYQGGKIKIGINCFKHGIFFQRPADHLSGYGCYECYLESKPKISDFIEKAKIKHGDTYDYSKTNFINNYTKIDIICKKHGVFTQRPNDHFNGNGCPICKESKGEKKIRLFLEDRQIKFEQQYKFEDCKDKSMLPYDFYLPELNMCIEFQGIQHFEFKKFFHKTINGFNKQLERDEIKKQYCDKSNIKLILIKYDEDVSDKLKRLL
jgi:hypothetical protein